jgi:hypothetical protein
MPVADGRWKVGSKGEFWKLEGKGKPSRLQVGDQVKIGLGRS